MKVAIMQPYFMPYIGYYQLMSAADKFVVYDNIEFSKRGWFHRNQILLNGNPRLFSLPLKKASDSLDVRDRELAETFPAESEKLFRRIDAAYKNAPQYEKVIPLIKHSLTTECLNLFEFIFKSLELTKEFLSISTELLISSSIGADHSLRSQERVIAICKALQATQYVNPIGGRNLYNKDIFKQEHIELNFLQPKLENYNQFTENFIPSLSIIDVMMWNSPEKIQSMLERYTLVN